MDDDNNVAEFEVTFTLSDPVAPSLMVRVRVAPTDTAIGSLDIGFLAGAERDLGDCRNNAPERSIATCEWPTPAAGEVGVPRLALTPTADAVGQWVILAEASNTALGAPPDWQVITSASITIPTPSSTAAPTSTGIVEIQATRTTQPTFWLEDVIYEVEVSNSGTEPLSAVLTTARAQAGAGDVSGMVAGPRTAAGNDDAVLDPGEVWLYDATIMASGTATFNVTAAAGAATVMATTKLNPSWGPFPEGLLAPIETAIETENTMVAVGETISWAVSVTNVAGFPVEVDMAVDPAPIGSKPGDQDNPPADRGDGDDILSPGEKWTWAFQSLVSASDTELEAFVGYRLPGGHPVPPPAPPSTFNEDWFVALTQSVPLLVTPPPTTILTTTTITPGNTGTTLPETGPSSVPLAGIAALCVLAGGGLVLAMRRHTAR